MHILVVTGASGVGKTTAVRSIEERRLPGVQCFYFDSIGVPSLEIMNREYGGGERWQAWATQQWLRKLDRLDPSIRIAVLDGQTRPSYVVAEAGALTRNVHTVLLDCECDERERRLQVDRAQSELASDEMTSWAAYLRGQADGLSLPVVETSRLSVEGVADRLAEVIDQLLASMPD